MKNVPGTKYIRCRSNGSFQVRHWENNKIVTYGVFPNLVEAKMYRDYCVMNDWNVSFLRRVDRRDCPKYIYKNRAGSFEIHKVINGVFKHFGSFHSLNDAVNERDNLIMCKWNYDAFESLDETLEEDNIIWLGRRMKA